MMRRPAKSTGENGRRGSRYGLSARRHSKIERFADSILISIASTNRSLRHSGAHPENEIGGWLLFRIEGNVPQALAS
jgi:hypothetical protein